MPKKVLVFTSATCAPCQQLKPEIEKRQAERGFDMEVFVLEENANPFSQFKVRAAPTVVCINENGVEVGRFTGGIPPAALDNHLKNWGL